MSTNRVYVTVNETYDLSTKENSLGLIAIHTPSTISLQKKFDGLFKQFKYIRFNSVSVRCACASLMPLDPLQVGLEAGMVAPQDMFNPILYTAVSNDSMGNLLDRIYSLNTITSDAESTTSGPSLDWVDNVSGVSTANRFPVYYSLLSSDKFRVAMPQQGFEMNNVVPLAHEIVTNVSPTGTYANAGHIQELIGNVQGRYFGHELVADEGSGALFSVPIQSYGAGVRPLPRIPTMIPNGVNSYGINEPTPVYCIAAILPPAKLQRLFFRMVVSWSITFEEFRPLDEIATFTEMATVGNTFYKSDYATQSASMSSMANALDGDGIEVELVTTSVS